MAKGNNAKEQVVKIIKDAFGENFINYIDKKAYVWADDGGEMVQIAISMTMPKTPVSGAEPIGEAAPAQTTEVDMSQEDKDKVAELMARLGIS